tara:strand:+ start:543 stop:995 length:453 start_codon:yes stop_codon:yes gene_type:complete
MSKITLQCVEEYGGKLRIRFYSFTDENDVVYMNVYNNNYNCRFPRNIRVKGRFYEIGPNDISLVQSGDRAPFYNIKKKNIKIKENNNIDLTKIKIYEVEECLICMSNETSQIFIPCGHLCSCKDCCEQLMSLSNKCPLCRRRITNVMTKQ